jgi:hypothetical protein
MFINALSITVVVVARSPPAVAVRQTCHTSSPLGTAPEREQNVMDRDLVIRNNGVEGISIQKIYFTKYTRTALDFDDVKMNPNVDIYSKFM